MIGNKSLRVAFGLFVSLMLVSTVASGRNQRRATEPPAVREIRRVLDQQGEAWNRQALDGVMKGYWHSRDLTFYSGGTTVSGWEETLRRYRTRYQTGGNQMGRLVFSDLKIELLGPNAAFVRGRFHLTMNNGES